MKIALIQPKMNMRPMDTMLKTRMAPSLALLTLAKMTPPGHEVAVINENIERLDFDTGFGLAAITVTVDVFNRAVRIAEEFRKRGVPVVAGGIHITAVPDTAAGHFDAVCVGPAERVWGRIINDAGNKALKKVYRDDENFCGSEIIPVNYALAKSKKYLYTNVITASRGCPYKCDFCYNSCQNSQKHVNRPVEDVLADIAAIGRGHIMFIDDNFIGNIAWTRELLTRIKPLRIKWNSAATVNVLNHPGLLDLMKESGCRSLFIGFESINRASIESVHKRQNNTDRYEALISEIHKRGIMINASLVFGLPGDGPDVFKSTLGWLVKNKIETVTSHILTPYPGTALYNRMLSAGRITDFNLEHYDTANVVFKPEKMSADELYRGYIRFYKEFYSVKNIFRRMPACKEQRAAYLLFNFMYRKYGKFTSFISKLIPLEKLGRLALRLSYGKSGGRQKS